MIEELMEQYFVVFQNLAEHFGCEVKDIKIRKQFGEGKSGDIVLLVCILQAANLENLGDYVLKIFASSDISTAEIEKTHQVSEYTDMKHILIPKLRFFGLSDFVYYLYDLAGDGFMQASNFAQLDQHAKRSRLGALSEYLLTEWNLHTISKQATLRAIIIDWLGAERLWDGSRLNSRVQDMISDSLADTFSFAEQQYPNAIYYLANEASPLTEDDAMLDCALYGQSHGDLNMNNIIVQMAPGGNGYQFFLIDFEQYRPCAPIFFDHAYLLLCVLLEDAVAYTLTEWCENINLFFESFLENGNLPNTFPHLYMKAHLDAIKQFTEHQQKHNRSSIKRQALAAHVAAGLNFVNKKGSGERQQMLAFLYASIAMRALISSLGKVMKTADTPPVLRTKQSGDPNLWRLIEHFSPENRYILLTSGTENSTDHLLNLAPIGWTMVIEINQFYDNPVREIVLPVFKRTQGYRTYELPEQEAKKIEAAVSWTHIIVPEGKKNLNLYYNRSIQQTFRQIVEETLSVRENETLFILADLSYIDSTIYNALIADIIAQAGENTPVQVISLDGIPVALDSDELIQSHITKSSLAELAGYVYQLRKHLFDPSEVRIPHKEGVKSIAPEKVAVFANDMILVHRNIIYGARDDNGEGFFHGNEVSWLDISNERDVIRLEYKTKWKGLLKTKIEQISSGASIVVSLRHRAGGGGTTVAKRIAWDFCNTFPTAILKSLSTQTAELIKELYGLTSLPLLIIAEVSDGQITLDGVNALRRELISKNCRVLFFCVSRYSGVKRSIDDGNFYLPNTPEMYMDSEESFDMLQTFSKQLCKADENTENIEARIQELNLLTYSEENEEMRQPFFYGLFTYGNHFHGVSDYVTHNSTGIDDNKKTALNILAMITAYTQSINLSFEETSLFLFPNQRPSEKLSLVKEWMFSNDLVVRRERGIRICHPIVAEEILMQNGLIQKGANEIKFMGTSALVELAIEFANSLVSHYGANSQRVDCIFREIFTHRDVVEEDEFTKFSALLTVLYTREQCAKLMLHIAQTIPCNPHYSNHLARLYLYPVTQNQTGVFPDVKVAETHALEAIERAKSKNKEGLSIHYHVLGKVYTQQCISDIKISLKKKGLYEAIKSSKLSYDKACNAFDICISYDKSGYGITGKLELISKILNTIQSKMHMNIEKILERGSQGTNEIAEIMSVASNLISLFTNQFDIGNSAFRNACSKFYSASGNLEKLELLFTANAGTLKQKSVANRAITALIIKEGFQSGINFSYDNLSDMALEKICNLMEKNLSTNGDNEQDRIRWFETYRRLPKFTLESAYRFLMDWPRGEEKMFVCYYRYIIAFLIYQTSAQVDFAEVKQHLIQSERLSQHAYGKNVTSSSNYYGKGLLGKESLVPWLFLDVEKAKEERIERNKTYREEHCKLLEGKIESLCDNMVTISFRCGDDINKFYAKTPNIYEIALEDEGSPVKFYLGFSYSGMRAWDVVLTSTQSQK